MFESGSLSLYFISIKQCVPADIHTLKTSNGVIVDITQSLLAGTKHRGEWKRLFLVPHLLPVENLLLLKDASFKFLFYFPTQFIPGNLIDQLIVKCNNDHEYDLIRWVKVGLF